MDSKETSSKSLFESIEDALVDLNRELTFTFHREIT